MTKKRKEGNKTKGAAVVEENDLADEYRNEYDKSNALILPAKKKKPKDAKRATNGLNLKKLDAKRRRLQAQEAKISKAKRRKLLRIMERKAKKQSRESLFESLKMYQIPGTSPTTLTEEKCKGGKRKKVMKTGFPKKLRSIGGSKATALDKFLDEEERKDYYETDSGSDSDLYENIKASTSATPQPNVSDLVMNVPDVNRSETSVPPEAKQNESSVSCLVEKSLKKDDQGASKSNEVAKKGIVEGRGSSRKNVLVERNEGIQKQRAKLPIFEEEQVIVEAVNENTTVIICGETGSGKTTQLPQFLYEAGYTGGEKMIGITEPRRVAAISMSRRVGYELCNPEIVSYQIRYEGNRSDKTRILFMTDGVLMKELQKDIMLSKYSVIIIDEAHERSMYSDVLIGLLSRIAPLRAKSSDPLKFVIMSATLRLADFMQKNLFPIELPRVLKVDARQYPVVPYFERRTPQNYIQAAYRKVCRIHENKPPGTILVFLSGRLEVEKLVQWLKERYPYREGHQGIKVLKKQKKHGKIKGCNIDEEAQKRDYFEEPDLYDDTLDEDLESSACDDFDDMDDGPLGVPPDNVLPLYCLPLYSLLPSDKQNRVFEPFPNNCRGCVVATNVAETSLTIPGVRYVVDSGREKRRLYDPVTGVSKFTVHWISQASADQRMGRAGRVQAGEAYRLYSRQFYTDLEEFSEPEILNQPVDQLVLHMKAMNIIKVGNFPFPSRPDPKVLDEAERRLIRLGALEVTSKNGVKESRITLLGKTLSLFPLDPKYGKMIVMAKQNDLLPYACCMVAALSVREPLIPVYSLKGVTSEETMKMMLSVLKLRRFLSGQGQSRKFGDLGVLLKVILEVETAKGNQEVCSRFGIRQKALVEIRKLRQQLTNLINSLCMLKNPLTLDPCMESPKEKQFRMLRQIVVASLTENIARRVDRITATEEVPKNAYECQKLKDYVFIDAGSVLYKEQPDWVLYMEIVEINGKKWMRDAVAVEPEWLPQLVPNYCTFAVVKGAEARYDSVKDAIVINSNCYFGEQRWDVGIVDNNVEKDINLYRLFAQYFLDGTLFPSLSLYVDKLLASPATMLKPWAKLQQRTEMLLNVLVKNEISSKAAMVEAWKKDSSFLLSEYLEWLPSKLHDTIQLSWPPYP